MPGRTDTFAAPLDAQARARPAHVALRAGAAALSYAQWAAQARAWGAWLTSCGVPPGARIALFGGGTFAHAVALFAIHAAGAVPAPQPLDEPEDNLIARLTAVRPAWAWLPVNAPAALGRACTAAGTAVLPLAVGVPLPLPPPAAPAPASSPARLAPPWLLQHTWAVLCTAGSTGVPKAIALTGAQVLGNAFAVAGRLGSLPSDVWLSALPWHHVGGLMVVYRTVLLGTQAVLAQPFAPADVAQRLDAGEISLAPLVPVMLERVLDARPALPFCARLRAVIVGGAPISAALRARAHALGVPLAPSWGMTETASQVATHYAFGAAAAAADDAGPPLAGVDIAAAHGVLTVSGLMAGAGVVSGDCGAVADNGHVHVHGRRDDVLISGGENVAVEPIEAVLRTHPAVCDAAVVGRACQTWGQRPVAYLQPHPHSGGNAPLPAQAALSAFCRQRLASFQRPVQFIWRASLPRDALGKLRRRVLRDDPSAGPVGDKTED